MAMASIACPQALHAEIAQAGAPEQVRLTASEWLRENGETVKFHHPSVTAQAAIGPSWRKYHLGRLSGVLKETFPNDAIAGSWQVSVLDGSEAIGRIHLSLNAEGARFSGFSPDTLAKRFLDASSFIKSTGMDLSEYEIREYSDLSMRFHALWLHSESADLMVPLVLPDSSVPCEFQVLSIREVQELSRPRVERLMHDRIWKDENGSN